MLKLNRAAEKIGIESTAIDHGPSGAGAVLQLSSATRDYELSVSGDGLVTLARVTLEGKRCKLREGGSRLESTWASLPAMLELE